MYTQSPANTLKCRHFSLDVCATITSLSPPVPPSLSPLFFSLFHLFFTGSLFDFSISFSLFSGSMAVSLPKDAQAGAQFAPRVGPIATRLSAIKINPLCEIEIVLVGSLLFLQNCNLEWRRIKIKTVDSSSMWLESS